MTTLSHARSANPFRQPARRNSLFAALRRSSALAVVLLVAGSLGCAFGEIRWDDWMQREYSLEELQKRYTDLVRFSNFSMATAFIDKEHRKEFMDSMPREDELRFLDYETDPFVLNEEMTESTITVVYSAYSPWSLRQVEVFETQQWTREEGVGNNWRVRSSFSGLAPYVKARTSAPPPDVAGPAAASNRN